VLKPIKREPSASVPTSSAVVGGKMPQRMGGRKVSEESVTQPPAEVVDETDHPSENEGSVLDGHGPSVGWNLQVGSFRHQANAVGLHTRLKDAKYQSYIVPNKTTEGELYTVLVGPMPERSAAEKAGEEIKTRLNLEHYIVRLSEGP